MAFTKGEITYLEVSDFKQLFATRDKQKKSLQQGEITLGQQRSVSKELQSSFNTETAAQRAFEQSNQAFQKSNVELRRKLDESFTARNTLSTEIAETSTKLSEIKERLPGLKTSAGLAEAKEPQNKNEALIQAEKKRRLSNAGKLASTGVVNKEKSRRGGGTGLGSTILSDRSKKLNNVVTLLG
jgi:predicted  nucleic acid-binding Zn-ribbon protein